MRRWVVILVLVPFLAEAQLFFVTPQKKKNQTPAIIIDWPAGTILMWTKDTTTIPSGWYICDGRSDGTSSTPDLRGRFIRQINSGETPGTVGGDTLFTPAFTDSAAYPAGVPAFTGTAEDSVVNHVHVQNWDTDASAGALAGVALDASSSGSENTAYYTANPTGGSATWTPAGTIAWGPSELPIAGTQATVQPRLTTVVYIRKK